ncbi:MAG: FecR family protein [Candidatus Acidiferrales bacterium]|jgi:hypothetical protein
MLLKRGIASFLCCLLAALPVLGEPQASGQHAGQIDALIPAATKNAQAATVKEELQWNDLLATEHTGRVRAGLADGSLLSLGSDSELRVVQHDAASQQTSLEMNFGKMRSQVVKITKPGGKFEMKTPNAVIGVIGTDFFAGYEANRTTVICYQGEVSVTPIGNAQVARNTGQTAGNSITVAAGQMVIVTSEIPPGGFHATKTPTGLRNSSILDTGVVTPGGPPTSARQGHALRNALITTGIAFGVGVGIAVAEQNGNKCVPGKSPTSGCP